MMLQMNPYLMMDGNAKEAIQFYEKSLEAKILFKQTVGEGLENPEYPMSAEEKELVAHSVLRVGETDMFVADQIPGQSIQRGNQITICITTNEMEKSKQLYESLKQEGQVNMQLQETYFSPAYGMVTDKFGVTFQIFTKRQQQH